MMDARCIVNAGEFQKALEKVLKVPYNFLG